jgi:hypothetical protein
LFGGVFADDMLILDVSTEPISWLYRSTYVF